MKRDIYLSEDFDTDSTDPSQMYQTALTIEDVGQVVLESKAIVAVIGDYLDSRRYRFERIDGNVRGSERQAAIDRFCRPGSDRNVFLLCTRAGGQGINLTAADTCKFTGNLPIACDV